MVQKLSLCLVCLILSACSVARTQAPTHHLPIDETLQVAMVLPGARWQLHKEAPPFVAQQMTEHLQQELSAAGHKMDEKQLLQLARKRLSVNEGYVVNEGSGAVLMVDFSLQQPDTEAPTMAELRGSAYGALLALENEAGVSGLESRFATIRIAGGKKACRVEARYLLDGKAHLFIGIIGYRSPYRYYFYYNDLLRNVQDQVDMEQILHSLELQVVP